MGRKERERWVPKRPQLRHPFVTQKDLIDLIERLATELQKIYTTADINRYLRRFSISGATRSSVSSKRAYVKELLADVKDETVLKIAEDLGIPTPNGVNPAIANKVQLPSEPYAFISYQHDDRQHAAQVKTLLRRIDVTSFMAHEDIEVSDEWRARLLLELSRATMFIAVLSVRYFTSPWCVQESGIAAFRSDMVVVPLSIDGTTPLGFLGHFQAKKIDPRTLTLRDLLPCFLRRDRASGLDIAVRIVGKSTSYRDAEANFEALLPHQNSLTDSQITTLLEFAASNEQVQHASRCAKEFLPPLIKSYGHLLDAGVLKTLRDTCKRYGATL